MFSFVAKIMVINYVLETCPDLQSPNSGAINISSDGSLSRALFDCLPGYEVDGEKELTCQSNGKWDFAAPLCGMYDPF